ncbi:MAG: hypothetical protein IKC99_05535, partial [Clostridia bacterium]|nr:hypothetical protein [Clostridia bacterium]
TTELAGKLTGRFGQFGFRFDRKISDCKGFTVVPERNDSLAAELLITFVDSGAEITAGELACHKYQGSAISLFFGQLIECVFG